MLLYLLNGSEDEFSRQKVLAASKHRNRFEVEDIANQLSVAGFKRGFRLFGSTHTTGPTGFEFIWFAKKLKKQAEVKVQLLLMADCLWLFAFFRVFLYI